MPNITGSPTQAATEVRTLTELALLNTTPLTTGDMASVLVGSNGKPQLYVFDRTSTAAPDGDQIINALGGRWINLITWTSLNAGMFTGTGPFVLNQVVYIDSANDIALADASNALKMPAVGFIAGIDLTAAFPYRVQYSQELTGFTGLTPGANYFVSASVPGGITTVPPLVVGNFVQSVGVAKNSTTLIVNLESSIINAAPPSGYPVSDAVFGIKNAVDPTKLLTANLAGQGAGTTATITTTAVVSRPFRLPNISGTAVVQQDATGLVLMGSDVVLHASTAGMQFSTLTLNEAQLRENQYGNNAGVPGIAGFKSRGLTIGALLSIAASDVLFRASALGVAPNLTVQTAGLISLQVPASFVPAAQAFIPGEYELQLVSAAGTQQVVAKVTSEGETQTLRGVRAGGPGVLPAALGAGTLWSSGTGSPEGLVVGSPGDLWSNTSGGAGATVYEKISGVATNTGWSPVVSANVTKFAPTFLLMGG